MSIRGELLADWVGDLRGALERQLERTPDAALHWRPATDMNSIGDTVWHIARWLDLVTMWLENGAAETQHWIKDGWAERTGYDPRGVGTDGLGAISGYTFAEVEAVPKLRRDQLRAYLGAVCDDVVPRLRAADDVAAARYKGVVQGAFGHVGEISALRTLFERQPAT
ncbi:MAG TPA: DinB family protein [Candidatus Saccharimonadales bacterium]|nr:DinB family protein [Candidatus Saccharimonadales bacterium]